MKKEKYIYPASVSKFYLNCEKKVIISMIPNGEGGEAKSEGRQ